MFRSLSNFFQIFFAEFVKQILIVSLYFLKYSFIMGHKMVGKVDYLQFTPAYL